MIDFGGSHLEHVADPRPFFRVAPRVRPQPDPEKAPAPRLVCSECGDTRTAGEHGARMGGMCWQPDCDGILRIGWPR